MPLTNHPEPKFEGWMGLSASSARGNMVWQAFPSDEIKAFEETDVDIAITHCGICGTDLHTLRIPEGVESEEAAVLLCAGITVYAPLREEGCGRGMRVGVVGVGGLGHLGLLFAKALGADKVVAISRRTDKRADALRLGADAFIATEEDPDWATTHNKTLDLIISTVSSPNMPLEQYLGLLRTKGQFIQLGGPEDKLPATSAFPFIMRGVKFGGSVIGSPSRMEEMLALAAEKGVRPWVSTRPMEEANEGIVDFEEGRARYRIVLVNREV